MQEHSYSEAGIKGSEGFKKSAWQSDSLFATILQIHDNSVLEPVLTLDELNEEIKGHHNSSLSPTLLHSSTATLVPSNCSKSLNMSINNGETEL